MYVRFTHLNFFPDKAKDAENIYNKELVPSIRQQQGIVDVMLLKPIDSADDYLSCTIWQSKADADAYQSSENYAKDFSKIKQMASKPPVVKYYEVTSA